MYLLWYHVWTWWVITLISSINEMIFYWYYLPYLLWREGDGRCSCCHGQWWSYSTSRTSYGCTYCSLTCSPICCTSHVTQGSLHFCLKLDNLITLSTICVDQLFDDRSFAKLQLLDIMPKAYGKKEEENIIISLNEKRTSNDTNNVKSVVFMDWMHY